MDFLSIIIPFYNESENLPFLLKKLERLHLPVPFEIVFVDDGSSDGGVKLKLIKSFKNRVKLINHNENQGKGRAIATGIENASGTIILIQDADMEYDPKDIPSLLRPILENKKDIVYGNRLWHRPRSMTNSHYLFNKFITRLANFFYKTQMKDILTGYKLLKSKCLENITIKSNRFEFECEITCKLLNNGHNIDCVNIDYNYRNRGITKIRLIDGLDMILVLFKYRYFNKSKLYDFLYNLYKNYYIPLSVKISKNFFFWVRRY
ncbi:MAG: glycosyltransferase family 2 protein [Promethearchaeota archaeon]